MTQIQKEPSLGMREIALRLTADKLPFADLLQVIHELKESIESGIKVESFVGLPPSHELRLLREQFSARMDRNFRWNEQAKLVPQPDLTKAKGCPHCVSTGWKMVGDHEMFPPTHCPVCQ